MLHIILVLCIGWLLFLVFVAITGATYAWLRECLKFKTYAERESLRRQQLGYPR